MHYSIYLSHDKLLLIFEIGSLTTSGTVETQRYPYSVESFLGASSTPVDSYVEMAATCLNKLHPGAYGTYPELLVAMHQQCKACYDELLIPKNEVEEVWLAELSEASKEALRAELEMPKANALPIPYRFLSESTERKAYENIRRNCIAPIAAATYRQEIQVLDEAHGIRIATQLLNNISEQWWLPIEERQQYWWQNGSFVSLQFSTRGEYLGLIRDEQIPDRVLTRIAKWAGGEGSNRKAAIPRLNANDKLVEETMHKLDLVIQAPTLLQGGEVIKMAGYDCRNRLFALDNVRSFPMVPECPTQADAQLASNRVLSLVEETAFANANAKGAWLAFVATVCAPNLYDGRPPIFAATANSEGLGKTFLFEIGQIIAAGKEHVHPPLSNEEFRKSYETNCMNGGLTFVIDNVRSSTEMTALDAYATANTIRFRELGKHVEHTTSNRTIIAISGVNIQYGGETGRRTVQIRLHSNVANPTEVVYRHDLRIRTKELRRELLVDVLTMLKAYQLHLHNGGSRPDNRRMASFQSWVETIRDAVLWATGLDALEESGDVLNNEKRDDHHVLCRLFDYRRATSVDSAIELNKIQSREVELADKDYPTDAENDEYFAICAAKELCRSGTGKMINTKELVHALRQKAQKATSYTMLNGTTVVCVVERLSNRKWYLKVIAPSNAGIALFPNQPRMINAG